MFGRYTFALAELLRNSPSSSLVRSRLEVTTASKQKQEAAEPLLRNPPSSSLVWSRLEVTTASRRKQEAAEPLLRNSPSSSLVGSRLEVTTASRQKQEAAEPLLRNSPSSSLVGSRLEVTTASRQKQGAAEPLLSKVFKIAFMFAVTAAAQEVQQIAVLKGEVRTMLGEPAGNVIIELSELQGRGARQRAFVDLDGSFELRAVSTGEYTVRVTTRDGRVVHEDLVNIRQYSGVLSVRLGSRVAQRPASGVVSLRQLKNRPPKKATKALAEAQRFSEGGKAEKALAKLQEAISLHPSYAEAYNNLGVHYIRTLQYEKALSAFQEAVRLDPDSAQPLVNLAYVLHNAGRYGEAEAVARRAVDTDKTYLRGRYMLGHILVVRGSKIDEARANLEMASSVIPRARLVLAHVYATRGDVAAASAELEKYLPNAGAEAATVRGWLAKLKSDAPAK